MRSLNRFRLLPRVSFVGALVLASMSCGTRRDEPHAVVSTPTAARTEPGYSIYDLDSEWKDQTGTNVSLASLRGAPRVVGLIYTRCSATCPMIVDAMKRLEAKAPANVGFLLVSLDPDRDSSARLAAYATEHGLSSRWTLLTGSDDATRDLAAALGAKFRRLSATELAHTNTITVLDASGTVIAQQPSWDAGGNLAALKSLAH